ncbi:MAG: hypothetical protein LBD01_03150, partial [Puniceicoccales bacterium]|nr:hypothetical protein [Puniceicoccales bacterium]
NNGAEGKVAECRAVRQPGPIEAPASEAWNEITDKAGHPRDRVTVVGVMSDQGWNLLVPH